MDIAIEAFGVPAEHYKPDYTFCTIGTQVHVGTLGEIESNFCLAFPELNIQKCGNSFLWQDVRFEVGGVGFDIAHHAPAGRLSRTRPQAAMRYAAELVDEYGTLLRAFPGEKMPHVAVRAHNHYRADSGDNYAIRVIYCPSWQAMTYYARRAVHQKVNTIGGLIFICEAGEYDVKKVYLPLKRDERWKKPK